MLFTGKTLFEDVNAWNALSKTFNDILKDLILQNTYLVIDALDECITDLPFLLDLVVQESSTHSHVKWIVSSRNWPGIEERLDTATQTAPISLELNEISVSNAVQQFIRHKFHQMAEFKKYKMNSVILFTVTCRQTHKALSSGWPWCVKILAGHRGGMSLRSLRSSLLDWMLYTVE